MGKTTNLLEKIIPGVPASDQERKILLQQSEDYHFDIADGLFNEGSNYTVARLRELFAELETISASQPTDYNYDYDRTVSFGEIISTTLISGYLNSVGISNKWVDVRQVIRTNENYREGIVDFKTTKRQAKEVIGSMMVNTDNGNNPVVVTQGFIAGTAAGTTTTLGREGSDYSASILSYCLDAESMTIWKDVPGFLNADPKFFKDTVKISQIPYNEAIELAYYGASVIHPKTVKPIQNMGIPLYIRSFITPEAEGSSIGDCRTIVPETPLYIFKNNQILLSILPRDFSFIAEDNLQIIFGILNELGIRVNLMQNSALSFSICIDNNPQRVGVLIERLKDLFRVRYNERMQLITIRYYTQEVIDSIVAGRPILLEQRSRSTEQLVVPEGK
jgi:aspartate kinase